MSRIIPATTEHAFDVAREMRLADIEECRAASGHSPGVACLFSLNESTHAWAGVDDDGRAFAICGVGPYVQDVGSPWMLATDRLNEHRKFFLRSTRVIVAAMLHAYPILMNYVDARHRESMRWLMWAGFKFDKLDMQHGIEHRPFFRFTQVAHVRTH